jgi:hypothetical protein
MRDCCVTREELEAAWATYEAVKKARTEPPKKGDAVHLAFRNADRLEMQRTVCLTTSEFIRNLAAERGIFPCKSSLKS